jgi:hypothetical protein
VSITLRPMRDDEFDDWLPRMRDDYVAGMTLDGGLSEEVARNKAALDIEGTFPNGRPSPTSRCLPRMRRGAGASATSC